MASLSVDTLPDGHPEHADNEKTPEFIFAIEPDNPTTSESRERRESLKAYAAEFKARPSQDGDRERRTQYR